MFKTYITFMPNKTICFAVSDEDYERGKKLPRDFNLSERMRKAYERILKEAGV